MQNKISKSTRKFIRQEKANIRKETQDESLQKEAIAKVYEKLGISRAVENEESKSE